MNPLSSISLQPSASIFEKRQPRTRLHLWPWRLTGVTCAVMGWAVVSAIAWATPSVAESRHERILIPSEELGLDVRNSGPSNNTIGGASRLFPDFRGTGRPGNHGSGASRGNCPLTLLIPEEAKYGGYTTVANPNVWAYVPCLLNTDSPITFSLLDGNGTLIYETFQVIDHEPGILKLDLPPSVSLEVGQVYKWYLMIHYNDPTGGDVDSLASGWIERIADPVTDDLEALSAVEQSNVYANQLIWYDALDILAEGLLTTPNDLQILEAWTNLLSLPSVKLEALSTQPIRECCTLLDSPLPEEW